MSPTRPPHLRPTNSSSSEEDVDPTFPRDFQLKMREMAKESKGKMRGFGTLLASIVAININIDGNAAIKDFANWLSNTFGDTDKTCWDDDDLLFYEGNYCTQNTVGSIPTWNWNGDYNNAFNLKKLNCWDNDEARSVIILPTFQGRDFIVCDHPTNCWKDDWTYVYIYQMPGGQNGYKIDTFEQSGSDQYVYMYHKRKNGLDGKVSRIGAWYD